MLFDSFSLGKFPSDGCIGSHQSASQTPQNHLFTDTEADELWYLEEEKIGRKLMSSDNDMFI